MIVGYLLNHKAGLEGEPGRAYNYVLSGNGLFIVAENNDLSAMVLIAPCQVRGLEPIEPTVYVTLRHGKIPGGLLDFALEHAKTHPEVEHYYCILWDEEKREYFLHSPPQESNAGHVKYTPVSHAIMDIHSHGKLSAFFSSTDTEDEQGFRLYLVLGRVDSLIPQFALRIGIYGVFSELPLSAVFQSTALIDIGALDEFQKLERHEL